MVRRVGRLGDLFSRIERVLDFAEQWLERHAGARLAPALAARHLAFRWDAREGPGRLVPIADPHAVDLADLVGVERPVAGTTCRPASVSSRMARRIVPSASCRALSSVPSKSLANILIMGMPLFRLHDIVDENGRAPREARPSGERLSYTAAGPCSPVRMRIACSRW